MRISPEIRDFLKSKSLEFIPGSRIYLFGSRADDTKRGGDIDVFIVAERKLTFMEKHRFIASFWQKFGEQKIDVLSYTHDDQDPFFSLIKKEAIELKLDDNGR